MILPSVVRRSCAIALEVYPRIEIMHAVRTQENSQDARDELGFSVDLVKFRIRDRLAVSVRRCLAGQYLNAFHDTPDKGYQSAQAEE